MASWDDYLFGALTGGLYNVGKAAYKAGEAAEDAGNAAEQAGVALATIGGTIETVGEQLTSLLKEAEELITIKRLTPRDESDLWEDEKERLDDLKEEKTRLENKLADLGVTDTGSFSFNFWDMISDLQNVMKQFRLMSRLVVVNNEIHEILYQEPGVVTNAIYNFNEVLERFNTIEQPKIEDILDSVDDNLEVTEETLKEIKKLFVTKRKVPLLATEISKVNKDKLKMLELDAKYYKDLIGRKDVLSGQLMNVMEKIPAKKYEITDKWIKVAGAGNPVVDRLDHNVIKGLDINIAKNADKVNVSTASSRYERSGYGSVSAANVRKSSVRSDVKIDKEEYRANISKSVAGVEKRNIEALSQLNFSIAKKSKFSLGAIQPHGAMISAVFNTKFDGYQRNYANFRAQSTFYHRELFKIDRKFDLLKYRWEEEPGVIPQTLDELKGILEQFRNEEQPRIDTVLDTLNENLEETKSVISKIDDTLGFVPDVVSSFNKYSKLIKIGLAVFVGVVFLDFVVAFFVLLRMALGEF